MNKWMRLYQVCLGVGLLALAVAVGGVLAIRSLGLPPHAVMPQPISFALLYGSMMLVIGVLIAGITGQRRGCGS